MENETKEKKKFSDIVKDNIQKITILIISIVYITQGMFTLESKNTTILDILGSIAISIIVGVVISSSLNSMGLKDGRNSKKFNASMLAYGEAKEKATKHFDKLQAFCNYKNEIELENKKKEIITNVGLKWSLYKKGYYNEHTPNDEEQVKALEDAKKAKIERIKPYMLLSDLPVSSTTKNRFGENEREYMLKGAITDFVSKAVMGVACGLYGLAPLITEDNAEEKWASVIWNTMQIAIWLTFGVLKYVQSKSFMEDEYRQTHIIQKTEYLHEFVVTCENNMDLINRYEDDLETEEITNE